MFECCYRSMLFISKMEFLCCLEKAIAFSANFSNLLCAALRIFEDLQWMIWHFCLLIVLGKILVQTSNDVYEIVAQSTLRSSWISKYPHPMLEEKKKKKTLLRYLDLFVYNVLKAYTEQNDLTTFQADTVAALRACRC